MGMPTATVKMTGPDAMTRVTSAVGSGPVDAAYKAVDELVRVKVELVEYSVTAVVEGIESLAQTRVSIRPNPPLSGGASMIKENAQTGTRGARMFTSTGADTDIVVSSTRAYVACLNRMIAHNKVSVEAAEVEAAAAAEAEAAAAEAEAPATA